MGIASCGKGNSSSAEADSIARADSIRRADSILVSDSIAKVHSDSIARADSIAKANSVRAAANSAKIDKLLTTLQRQSRDIKSGFYTGGQWYPITSMGVQAFVNPWSRTNRQLKALKGQMTPAQKAKYQQILGSLRGAPFL